MSRPPASVRKNQLFPKTMSSAVKFFPGSSGSPNAAYRFPGVIGASNEVKMLKRKYASAPSSEFSAHRFATKPAGTASDICSAPNVNSPAASQLAAQHAAIAAKIHLPVRFFCFCRFTAYFPDLRIVKSFV